MLISTTTTPALEKQELSQYELERNKPMPSLNHSLVQARLSSRLLVDYEDKYTILPEISLKLPKVKPAVPDIAIYPILQNNWEKDIVKMIDPPITIIEILSPKQKLDDILDKFSGIYFPAGVKSAWLVIPPVKHIFIYSPNMKFIPFYKGTLKDTVTGINLDLGKIFK